METMRKDTHYARIRSRHDTHDALRRNPALRFKLPVIIRFGSLTEGKADDIQINTVESIQNCSNKIRMKELFSEGKIKSPKFFSVDDVTKKKVHFPLVKKLFFRSRGQGMKLINNEEELKKVLASGRKDIYFEEYFNGSREYRLHVSELGCFYTCRKLRKTGAKERWFFNSSNCNWILEDNKLYNKPENFDAIVKECQKALKVLGLDFAAFDVRVSKDGTFVIIEANSAPSFGEITTTKYIEHLPLLINRKIEAKCAE